MLLQIRLRSVMQYRIAKVEPLYNQLIKLLMQFEVFAANLSLGESMVLYYSHNGAKMFVGGNP